MSLSINNYMNCGVIVCKCVVVVTSCLRYLEASAGRHFAPTPKLSPSVRAIRQECHPDCHHPAPEPHLWDSLSRKQIKQES